MAHALALYARSPGQGAMGDKWRVWHAVKPDGSTPCGKTAPGGLGWDMTDRLPRRAEAHCRVCFPDHDPGPVRDYRPRDWMDAAIQTAQRISRAGSSE